MKKSVLLVIDFINDIVDTKGKIAGAAEFVKDNHVIKNANQVIQFSRQNNIPAVFIKVGFHAGYPECPEHSPIFGYAKKQDALQLNTWGTEFHSTLNKNPDDLVIIKNRVSAFYATSLEAYLRANQIENLFICGVSTDMAVQLTAREAHDRDYKVTIIADACGAGSKENHENSLKLLQRIATIINTNELTSHGQK